MTDERARVVLLGAASSLGACVLEHLARQGPSVEVLALDVEEHLEFLEHLIEKLDVGDRFDVVSCASEDGLISLSDSSIRKVGCGVTHLLHVGQCQDRSRSGDEIRRHNLSSCELALQIARLAECLEAVVITTDVGIAGDYPGRFYESWTNVSQLPFDEVDRSSLEVEQLCLEESEYMPITRARIGILSDPRRPVLWARHWPLAAEVFLPSLRLLRKLPRGLRIPTAMAKASRGPMTPIEWAAAAIWRLAHVREAAGSACHLVLWHPPMMAQVLEAIHAAAGGARVTGGLPMRAIELVAHIPGMREMARIQADQLSSWWTPHRYCLSPNDLDTARAERFLGPAFAPPAWAEISADFFRKVPR